LRYFVLALLMFALGVLASTFRLDPRPFHSVVRLRTADGFFMTLVQAHADSEKACMERADGFVTPLERACPTCVVESVDCSHDLAGIDRALADGTEVPLYRVTAAGVNMALVGPPSLVRERCEQIAEAIVAQGMKTAACVYPQAGAAPRDGVAVTK